MSRARLFWRWAIAAGTVSIPSVCICLAGRALNTAYATEVLWVVAEYRAPDVWASLLLVNVAAWVWLARAQPERGRLLPRTLLSLAVTLALGLELGMGVYYRESTGELKVGELLWTREALELPAGPDGACFPIDLTGRWSWQLNGRSIHPRLLPLRLDTSRLAERLARAAACPL